MAAGIAARLVAAGADVVVRVRRDDAVPVTEEQIVGRLSRLAGGRRTPDHAERRLTVRNAEPAGPFGIIIESVTEDLAVKRSVLAGAEQYLADDGILATNTSSLRLADLASGLGRPETSPAGTGSTRPSWSRWSRSSAARVRASRRSARSAACPRRSASSRS